MVNLTDPQIQIRFGGYKGIAVEDRFLGDEVIKLGVRRSQKKFSVPEKTIDVEVANAFVTASKMYLNRSVSFCYSVPNVLTLLVSPLIQILECLGVPSSVFIKLQQDAVSQLQLATESMSTFITVLKLHKLGLPYRLGQTLKQLAILMRPLNGEVLEFKTQDFGPFVGRLIEFVSLDALRHIKYQGRIPVPKSWNLVGVADEGVRYRFKGRLNTKLLKDREVYGKERNLLTCSTN